MRRGDDVNKVCIYGGLGNQMFQYAFCAALQKRGVEARISFVRYFYDRHHQGFDLWKAFHLPLPPLQKALCELMTKMELLYRNRLCEWLLRVVVPRLEICGYSMYRERNEFSYDPSVFERTGSLMEGTWQAESYFDECSDDLRNAFRFKLPRDPDLGNLAIRMQTTNSISIHIRRGDYYSKAHLKTHSVLSSHVYYENALEYIRERVTDPKIFIFSDDIPWVKKHFPLKNITYVENNQGERSYIDMYLMSICKHNIIANSTFSWWGAWLNVNPDKIVVMPEVWLNGKECPGIYSRDWIRLPVDRRSSFASDGIDAVKGCA